MFCCCVCRYFIPEDGDDETHPNVFLAPKARQPGAPPTLQAVKDAFPLPGHYHFRFKSPLYPGGDRDKGSIPVWMDVTQPRQPVPAWKNSIVAKVTRISMEEDDDDDDEDFGHRNTSHQTPPPTAAAQPTRPPPSHASSNVSTTSGEHLDIFDGPTPTPAGPPAAATPNLFDGHPPSAPASGGSLLDFGASPPAPSSGAHNDFLGMTAPAQGYTAQQPPPQQMQQPPPQQAYQQQQQQQRPPAQSFNSYGKQAQPFGDLNWR